MIFINTNFLLEEPYTREILPLSYNYRKGMNQKIRYQRIQKLYQKMNHDTKMMKSLKKKWEMTQ